jgi:RNA polymerase sigma factor (TIGR02999 family)
MAGSPAMSMLPTNDDGAGADALFNDMYQRLKAMASRGLAANPQATLQTTALVHELYLRVVKNPDLAFAENAQFFAYAARAMRHLLLDRARDRLRRSDGQRWITATLDPDDPRLIVDSADEAIAMEDALVRLEGVDARAARVVELRYFAGLSLEQTADVLGLARTTIDRDWRYARAFLHAALD